MVEMNTKLTLEGGKGGNAVDELNRLIAERSKVLHQTTFQATAAVAINALQSIRSATKDARKTQKFNIKVEQTPYYFGFSKSENKPCLRSGPTPTSAKVTPEGKVIFLTSHIVNPVRNAKVFKVTQEKVSHWPLYIVCQSQHEAENYAIKATKHRINALGTLGRNALGVAMAKVADKSKTLEGSVKSQTLASQLATVNESKNGNEYKISIKDNLDYATDAMKGGEAAIEIALQKAANKVYGMLAHFGDIDFTERFPEKPFPEVGGKK